MWIVVWEAVFGALGKPLQRGFPSRQTSERLAAMAVLAASWAAAETTVEACDRVWQVWIFGPAPFRCPLSFYRLNVDATESDVTRVGFYQE